MNSHSKIKKYFKLLNFFLILSIFLSGCSLLSFTKKEAVDCNKFKPVCGQDGITYYNICQSEPQKIEIDYEGPCNDKANIKTIPFEVKID